MKWWKKMDQKEEQKTTVPEAAPNADEVKEATEETAGETPRGEAPDEAAPAEGKPEQTETADGKTEQSETAGGETTAEAEQPAESGQSAGPDWKDRYARAMADFDNFRKRTARDREDLVKFAAADVIKSVLTTVDNLALALDKAKDKEDDPFVQGVKLVYDGLLKTLADQGAVPLDSLGEPFDANFHEALAQLPSPTVEEGRVMNEVKRGWLLHGKLLRPAQVVVSSGKGE